MTDAHGRADADRFATAGSVDDGKSTLVGRLLHDLEGDPLRPARAGARPRPTGRARRVRLRAADDGLRAEREQGITIDVAYRTSPPVRGRSCSRLPGHVQYTRNMVTGATTADAVVVLIDARKGVLEQTRRHLAVVALLRVPHVVVAVNKIDLLDFAEDRYTPVAAQVSAVAAELGIAHIYVLPVSALEGDNIVERSARTPGTKAALLELLETLPARDEARDALRLPPAGAAGAATAGRPGPRARRGPRGRRALSRPPLVRGADLVEARSGSATA
jgi:sulfate adenylyltransferase subunit 1